MDDDGTGSDAVKWNRVRCRLVEEEIGECIAGFITSTSAISSKRCTALQQHHEQDEEQRCDGFIGRTAQNTALSDQ